MASNKAVLDYIEDRRRMESSLNTARRMVEKAEKELKSAKDYCTNCYVRLQDHNDNPPALTERQEAWYGSRVRDK